MPSPLINIAIVDDHTLFRKTLKNYLSEQKNLNVVIQAASIADLLNQLKDYYVQVLIMDVYMPRTNGNEAVNMIRSLYPDIKILVLTMGSDMEILSDMLDAGVYGIVSKTDEPEELLRAIDLLSEQRIYRNKLFTDLMYRNKQMQLKDNSPGKVLLDEREKEVVKLLWEEKSNKEIADHLYLSVRSVEKIRQDIKEKTGAKSTIGVLKYAINQKIIGANLLLNNAHSVNR